MVFPTIWTKLSVRPSERARPRKDQQHSGSKEIGTHRNSLEPIAVRLQDVVAPGQPVENATGKRNR